MSAAADEARAARLAAIESRLRPKDEDLVASASTNAGLAGGSASPSGSGSGTPLFGSREPPRNLPKGWTRPSARDELERRRELARVLNRTVVRDSGYRQAAECVETLLKIATNIQTASDDKFRTLKGDNPVLKNKVFSAPGGREFMVLMGFHTETRNFIPVFILDQSQRRMYELGLAADVLREALPPLQERLTNTNMSKTAHKQQEAARIAAAKKLIEDDRASVKIRTERERASRAAADENARKAAEAAAVEEAGDKELEAGEEDEDEPTVEGYTADRRWGHGKKLGE